MISEALFEYPLYKTIQLISRWVPETYACFYISDDYTTTNAPQYAYGDKRDFGFLAHGDDQLRMFGHKPSHYIWDNRFLSMVLMYKNPFPASIKGDLLIMDDSREYRNVSGVLRFWDKWMVELGQL